MSTLRPVIHAPLSNSMFVIAPSTTLLRCAVFTQGGVVLSHLEAHCIAFNF